MFKMDITDIQFNKISSLKEFGFEGFCSITDLMADKIKVPCQRGNYVLFTPKGFDLEFRQEGAGGFFKGKNPNVEIASLVQNWIEESRVVYIGQAGGILKGKWSNSTLNERLCAYMKFGQGWSVAHWGGRLIWQINNCKDLRVCRISWLGQIKDPRKVETELLAHFEKQFYRLPFANLRH